MVIDKSIGKKLSDDLEQLDEMLESWKLRLNELEACKARAPEGVKEKFDDAIYALHRACHPVSTMQTNLKIAVETCARIEAHDAAHLAQPNTLADAGDIASATVNDDDQSFAGIVGLVVELGPEQVQKIARIFAVHRRAYTRTAQKGCAQSESG